MGVDPDVRRGSRTDENGLLVLCWPLLQMVGHKGGFLGAGDTSWRRALGEVDEVSAAARLSDSALGEGHGSVRRPGREAASEQRWGQRGLDGDRVRVRVRVGIGFVLGSGSGSGQVWGESAARRGNLWWALNVVAVSVRPSVPLSVARTAGLALTGCRLCR